MELGRARIDLIDVFFCCIYFFGNVFCCICFFRNGDVEEVVSETVFLPYMFFSGNGVLVKCCFARKKQKKGGQATARPSLLAQKAHVADSSIAVGDPTWVELLHQESPSFLNSI